MCLLEASCSVGSVFEYYGGKPPKFDALVSIDTSVEIKNETSSNLIMLPPKDAPL